MDEWQCAAGSRASGGVEPPTTISCEGATSEIHLQFSISKTNGFFEIVDATGAIYPTIGTVIVGGNASLLNEQMTDYFANYGLSALCDFLDDDHTITCNIVIKNVSAGNKQLIVNTDGTLLRVLTDFDSTPAVTVSGSTLRCCLAPANEQPTVCEPGGLIITSADDVLLPENTYYIDFINDGQYHNLSFGVPSNTLFSTLLQTILTDLKENYGLPVVFETGGLGAFQYYENNGNHFLEGASGDGSNASEFTLEWKGALNPLVRNNFGDGVVIKACGVTEFPSVLNDS